MLILWGLFGSAAGVEEEAFLAASQQAEVDQAILELRAAPEAAAEIADDLAHLETEALVGYLGRASSRESLEHRRGALALLRVLPTILARDPLLNAALRTGCPDQDATLNRAAQLDRQGTVLNLVQRLGGDGPMSGRIHSAFALGNLSASEATATLRRFAEDRAEAPFLRRACLSALSRLAPAGYETELISILSDSDAGVAREAERILKRRYAEIPRVRDLLASRAKKPERRPRDVPVRLAQTIMTYAKRFRLDPNLVAAVIEVESDFKRLAKSKSGAQGLMQLMPDTAAELGVKNAFDPRQNVRGGSRYLRMMLNRFRRLEFALAAYNAGPTAVDKYGGIPPYPETKRYVKKVMRAFRRRGGR